MTKLAEQVAAAEAAGRAKAAVEYREILVRADAPRKGDVERLAECLRALGKSAADVEADAAILAKAAALEVEAAGLAEAEAARVAANEAVIAHHDETAKIAQERAKAQIPLGIASVNASEKTRRCREAGADLAVLRQRHWALFGLPEPPPAVPDSPALGVGLPRPL